MLLQKWYPSIKLYGYRALCTDSWMDRQQRILLFVFCNIFPCLLHLFLFHRLFLFYIHKTFCTLKNTTSEIWVRMKSRVVNFSTTRHSIFLSKKMVTLHPVIVACSQLITIVGPAEGPKIWRDNWISFLKVEGCASIMVKN